MPIPSHNYMKISEHALAFTRSQLLIVRRQNWLHSSTPCEGSTSMDYPSPFLTQTRSRDDIGYEDDNDDLLFVLVLQQHCNSAGSRSNHNELAFPSKLYRTCSCVPNKMFFVTQPKLNICSCNAVISTCARLLLSWIKLNHVIACECEIRQPSKMSSHFPLFELKVSRM